MSANNIIYIMLFTVNGLYVLKGGFWLDIQRAKQIIESKGVIEVLYGDSPVWIESLNGNTANISYMHTKKKTRYL